MESKKLYGASTQMTPAVYKDFYKTYYNEKLKVFKIVAEIVGSARPAREDFENAGERGVLRHLFRDPGADFRGYQIVGRSGAVVVVVVGAGYGGEQKCESP